MDQSEDTLIGGKEERVIEIVDYDPIWPNKFEEHAKRIRDKMGSALLEIEHIGSTSVPNLAAKPIIDMLIVVEDSANESLYLRDLEELGYQLRVREPDFHEHRMFRTPELDLHLHVYTLGSSEIDRYLLFREHLRTDSVMRDQYADLKRELSKKSWSDMNEYADAKSAFIEEVIKQARSTARSEV